MNPLAGDTTRAPLRALWYEILKKQGITRFGICNACFIIFVYKNEEGCFLEYPYIKTMIKAPAFNRLMIAVAMVCSPGSLQAHSLLPQAQSPPGPVSVDTIEYTPAAIPLAGICKAAGIEIPFPQRDLLVRSVKEQILKGVTDQEKK